METAVKREKLTYSVPEAAELLGVSPAQMYILVKQTGFPVLMIGRRLLIPCQKFKEWVDNQAAIGWQK